MKTCNCCNTIKKLTEFYANPGCSDGYQHKCIECIRADRAKKSDKPAKEIDMRSALSRIELKRTNHGFFPVVTQPATQRAFS